jgi:hypothetical protein
MGNMQGCVCARACSRSRSFLTRDRSRNTSLRSRANKGRREGDVRKEGGSARKGNSPVSGYQNGDGGWAAERNKSFPGRGAKVNMSRISQIMSLNRPCTSFERAHYAFFKNHDFVQAHDLRDGGRGESGRAGKHRWCQFRSLSMLVAGVLACTHA